MKAFPNIKVPVGRSGFADIRKNGYYYVDKSGLVGELLRTEGVQAVLITRPRRFGKTLAMSMLAEFFDIRKDSRALFEGLSVAGNAGLCAEWMNQYPTLSLSFRTVDGLRFENAYMMLAAVITGLYIEHLDLMESAEINSYDKEMFNRIASKKASQGEMACALASLTKMMSAHYHKPVILLIDEYDAPLAKASEKGYYAEMLDLVRGVMQVVKDNDCLKLAVITGCLRIAKESIFTGVNNLVSDTISDTRLNEYFGFTQAEVDRLLQDSGLLSHRGEIREWYDGYRFGRCDMYCPWDVMNHVNSLILDPTAVPKNYWENTSDNAIIRTFLRRTDFAVNDKFEALLAGGHIQERITDQLTYDMLESSEDNLWSLLYLTGYLTRARTEQLSDGCLTSGEISLKIPNREIQGIFRKNVMAWFNERTRDGSREEFFTALWDGNAEKLTEIISDLLFDTISYYDYRESFYHAFLTGLLSNAGYAVESNYENGLGRSDITVKDRKKRRAVVIEAKWARNGYCMARECEDALRQIEDRQYAKKLEHSGFRSVVRLGAAFFQKQCLVKKDKKERTNHNMTSYKKIKNLFLRQSCLDSWEDYERSLRKGSFIKWDYIILTASNEAQARAFRMQIQERLDRQQLPDSTRYEVLPDPGGKRVGSGGATFHVMRYLAEQDPGAANPFAGKRILVIHSGGDSKRVPQYSALGKLFSPVPRQLPDGRGSTLFDEFIIGMSGVPSRIREGMLVLSGDVLLLFNPLQIDFQFRGAAAISIKEPVETGKDHGVFLNDGHGYVKSFLHKQTEETLRRAGAVNERGAVDLDTGAVILDAELLQALYGLVSTEGKPDEEKYGRFVNERARVSFYGDFLYPLASSSTLEQFYREAPEGEDTEELKLCRREIWEALGPFSLKLLCLSPAQFIHFGTTRELRQLVAEEIGDFEFLDWQRQVNSTRTGEPSYSAYSSYVGRRAVVGEAAYLENSYILEESRIGRGSIVSHLKLRNVDVPEQVVLHGLPLKGGAYTVRIYGVCDNPKGNYESDASYMHTTLKRFLGDNALSVGDLWEDSDTRDLWNARLFPVCTAPEEAVSWALALYRMASGEADGGTLASWRQAERVSLCQSFGRADLEKVMDWQAELENRIFCRKFIDLLADGVYYKEALQVFGQNGITDAMYTTLMEDASQAEFSIKIRIYYALSQYMKEHKRRYAGRNYDYTEGLCFRTIQQAVYEEAVKKLPDASLYRIAKDQVEVKLPVRVNWGGGWTDTPPYCNENGGVVLNAAISLNGILPVQIMVKRLPDYHVEFESQDIGVFGRVETVEDIQDCHNPYDSFALHKAALIACGIVPLTGGKTLEEILRGLGGGLYLSTQVIGIPKGSGLGTSSILAGACVKGLFEFLGLEKTNEEIYEIVLSMEQIMSTGGGWQDQVGGLTGGIKFISTRPGIGQKIEVAPVVVPGEAMRELQERFALVYTGQRRLARNLLRDVVGNYIGARPASVEALKNMQPVAALMKHYLERGDIDAFAGLMNEHWELSKQLDRGSTNTCIDQIFVSCEDLIDARFIAGAGGGGFIMVILKKGVSRGMLRERLAEIFQDSGVDVWESAFV